MSRKKHYYRKKRRKRTVPVLLALVVLILGIAGYGNGQADSISSALNTILTAASDLASGGEIQTAYAPSDVTEDLTVHFLDIGQGDCTLLTQDGHAMLIDAGDNDQGTKVQSYLEYLGISSLNFSTKNGLSGLGPTRLMSPFRILKSCGSSSMLVLRINLPIPVTLGSFLTVHALRSSASG